MRHSRALVVLVSVALTGCSMFGGGRPHRPQHQEAPWHPASAMLTKYITNADGSLTRAQLEAGLRADFAKADTNHDGRLDETEARAVNEQRLAEDKSTASPLVDWNHDGYIDFDEFAAAPRSLFDQMDRNGDGTLTREELNPNPGPEQGHRQQPLKRSPGD
jgi:hypothetical protein